jgi:tritrans,polycis-undecaprenyl-diphosphate synthase [geranylgeranyl-diphosphate specific]
LELSFISSNHIIPFRKIVMKIKDPETMEAGTKIPQHISIIPDGNRRCARRLMKQPWKGHEWGVKKINTVTDWCRELGIKAVTFYALSLENLDKRPRRELNFLFRLARKWIKDMVFNKKSKIHRERTRVVFFGRIDRLPDNLQADIGKAMEMTRDYKGFHLNIAMAYGGRQEILEACRSIGSQVHSGGIRPGEINEAVLRHNLQTNGDPDPDIIIRTGQERRISNFLLFQSAYSELAFLDCFWPDLTKQEFLATIQEFSQRNRRFGK